jgi:hypothetical protein
MFFKFLIFAMFPMVKISGWTFFFFLIIIFKLYSTQSEKLEQNSRNELEPNALISMSTLRKATTSRILSKISSVHTLIMICFIAALASPWATKFATLQICLICQTGQVERIICISATNCSYLHQFGPKALTALTTCEESSSRIISCNPRSQQNSPAHKAAWTSTTTNSCLTHIVWHLAARPAITYPSQSLTIIPIPMRIFLESMVTS